MPFKRLLIILAVGLITACIVSAILFDGGIRDTLAGWVAASVINVISHLVLAKAIGRDTGAFMGMALGTIFSRLFSLIILLVIVLVGGFFWTGPFIVGLLITYFSGVWAEIHWLARSNQGKQ